MPLSKPFYAAAVYEECNKRLNHPTTTQDENNTCRLELIDKSDDEHVFSTPTSIDIEKQDIVPESNNMETKLELDDLELGTSHDIVPESNNMETKLELDDLEVGTVEEIVTDLKIVPDLEVAFESLELKDKMDEIIVLSTTSVDTTGEEHDIVPDKLKNSGIKLELDYFCTTTPEEVLSDMEIIFKSDNVQLPPGLIPLSDEIGLAIEIEEFKSAMDLLDKTIDDYNMIHIMDEGIQNHEPHAIATTPNDQDQLKILDSIVDDNIATIINETTSALDLNPIDIIALERRALGYSDYGYYDEAFEDVTSLCFLEYFKSIPMLKLSKILLNKITTNEADKLYNNNNIEKPMDEFIMPKSIGFFMNDPINNYQMGHEDSGEEFEKWLLSFECGNQDFLKPNYKLLCKHYLIRGSYRHLLGHREHALHDYNTVLSNPESTNDENSSAWIKKGLLYAEESNIFEMLGIESDPAYSNINENQIMAKLCYEKAKIFTPNNPDIYFALAHLFLLQKNDIDSAFNYIEIACDLEPNFELYKRWKLYLRIMIATERHSQEGIREALLEFQLQPTTTKSNSIEILKVDICILAWMGQYSEAHLKLDQLDELKSNDPRIYIGKLLLHEMIYNDKSKNIFYLFQDTFLNYSRCKEIYTLVGKYAFKIGLLEPCIECFTKALKMTTNYEHMIHLIKFIKIGTTYERVITKFELKLENYSSLKEYHDFYTSDNIHLSE